MVERIKTDDNVACLEIDKSAGGKQKKKSRTGKSRPSSATDVATTITEVS
jgi:hypothetical protein